MEQQAQIGTFPEMKPYISRGSDVVEPASEDLRTCQWLY